MGAIANRVPDTFRSAAAVTLIPRILIEEAGHRKYPGQSPKSYGIHCVFTFRPIDWK